MIAAGTISGAQNTVYQHSYDVQLKDTYTCATGYWCAQRWPARWSVHDYADPSTGVASSSGDIAAFSSQIYSDWGLISEAWITESAVNLNDGNETDANPYNYCWDGEYDHYDAGSGYTTFGACVDGNASAQAAGAQAFKGLGGTRSGETVTQVLWYEFQAANGSTGWDSGLLTPPGRDDYGHPPNGGTWAELSPDAVYGGNLTGSGRRQSFCTLAGAGGCSSAATDGSDWSGQPRQDAGTAYGGGSTLISGVTGENRFPLVGSWVTCFNYYTGYTCSQIPANTKVTSVSDNGDGTSTFGLSQPTTSGGTVQMDVAGP
jgi:hypothetical protein